MYLAPGGALTFHSEDGKLIRVFKSYVRAERIDSDPEPLLAVVPDFAVQDADGD